MNGIFYNKRQYGLYHTFVVEASEILESGGSVGIVSNTEDNGAEKMAKAIKDYSGVEVTIRRVTKKDPANNRKLLFDEWGEVIGIDILPQIDKFTGWELKVAPTVALFDPA